MTTPDRSCFEKILPESAIPWSAANWGLGASLRPAARLGSSDAGLGLFAVAGSGRRNNHFAGLKGVSSLGRAAGGQR
jgi:hypothetical protein